MTTKKTKSIRLRLLAPFALSLIIIILGIQFVLYLYQQEQQHTFTQNLQKQLNNSVNHELTRDSEQIRGFLNFITSSQAIKQAWINKDRKQLLQLSIPYFLQLKSNHQITHLYFHNPDGSNFLRAHAAEQYGDKVDRETFLDAFNNKKPASGIELEASGKLVLRVVTPWMSNGEIIGYIESGQDINHIITRIEHLLDEKIIISTSRNITPDSLTQKTQQQADTSHTQNTSPDKTTDTTPHTIIISQDETNLSSEIINLIKNQPTGKYITIENKSSSNLVSSIQLQYFSKNNTYKLTFIRDISEHLQQQKNIHWRVLIINISVGLTLLTFYYLYSGLLEQGLRTNYNRLKNEIRDRLSAEKELLENKNQLEKLIRERDLSLLESKRSYRTLFDKTADALLLIEGEKIIDCNQATLDMFLFKSKEEIYNTHLSRLSPPLQPDGELSSDRANQMMQSALDNGSHRFEWCHARKNGSHFSAEVLLTAIPSGDRQLLHAVVRDISDRKSAEEEIKYRAYYDSLTKLPNRQLLLDRLQQLISSSIRRADYNALMFLDLDRFKTINDSLGHSVGDLLLVETAKRINSCIRKEDTAARFGGDEFVVLLQHLGEEQEHASLHAQRIAEDIQRSFQQPFRIKDQDLHISSSIGVCMFPLASESMEDIIKHADTAMYSAKQAGRNRIAFYLAEMHDSVLQRLTLEKDLHRAIKANQLELYYQPQLDNDKNISGIEALLRWKHPLSGFVNPEEFISIGEDSGLIFELGDFVLRQAMIDIHHLQQANCMPPHIAINISPHQFRHPDFIRSIKHLTQLHKLKHNVLTLEVTEGVIIDNLTETIEKFNLLRELGVRLSLDDFGTGYSSLSYLKRLPLDELKIDKSFIFDILKDPHDALLVQTIINIANQFGLKTVAEGVENKEQLDFLKKNACTIYQGYYYSRPLPLAQLTEFLQHHKHQNLPSSV